MASTAPLEVAALTAGCLAEMVECRRHLHQFPELSGHEEETAALVADRLRVLGLEVRTGVGGHGVVGVLRGPRAGPVVAIRADMDALPIQDAKQVSYASRVRGRMHACGHDVHTACALGAATVLSQLRDQLQGAVKFVFQPAEEVNTGARAMIADGVLHHPEVDACIALHVDPGYPAGCIAITDGGVTAAEDNFEIQVAGAAAHAAMPHRATDAILAAAQTVLAMQSIISRNTDPLDPAVLSICTIHGGEAQNVIASAVRLGGTVRTLSPDTREQIPRRMRAVLEGIRTGLGCGAELDYRQECPPAVNTARLVDAARAILTEQEGPDAVRSGRAVMVSEDFAWYLEQVPGMLLWLGAAPEGRPGPGLHTPHFDVNEQAIAVGVRTLSHLALRLPRYPCF